MDSSIRDAQDSAVDVRSSLSKMHKELLRMERRKAHKTKKHESPTRSRHLEQPLLGPPGAPLGAPAVKVPGRLEKRRRALRNVLRHKVKRDHKLAAHSILAAWKWNAAAVVGRKQMEQRLSSSLAEVERERAFMRRLEVAMQDLYSGIAEDMKVYDGRQGGMMSEEGSAVTDTDTDTIELAALSKVGAVPSVEGSTRRVWGWGSDLGDGKSKASDTDFEPVNFSAWSEAPEEGNNDEAPRLQAARGLLQVMAHTNKNEWLGDRMRKSLFHREIPTFTATGIQASPESHEVSISAIPEVVDSGLQTVLLDHARVALKGVLAMRSRQDAMKMSVVFMKILENFMHRNEDEKVAKAVFQSRQRLLKLGILRVQQSQMCQDAQKKGINLMKRWAKRIQRREVLARLVSTWRSQVCQHYIGKVVELEDHAQAAVEIQTALQQQIEQQAHEIDRQGNLAEAKLTNEAHIAELERSLRDTAENSIKEVGNSLELGRQAGARQIGVRHIDWILHNHEGSNMQPKAISNMLYLWHVQARAACKLSRSLKELKTQAARSISKLKTEAKVAAGKQAEQLSASEKIAMSLRDAVYQGTGTALMRASRTQQLCECARGISSWRSNQLQEKSEVAQHWESIAHQRAEELVTKQTERETELELTLKTHAAELQKLAKTREEEIQLANSAAEKRSKQDIAAGKRRGHRDRMVRQLDAMLHSQGNLSTTPTAISLYLAIWAGQAQVNSVEVAAQEQKQFALARQSKQNRRSQEIHVLHTLLNNSKRRVASHQHALLHVWYSNASNTNASTAVAHLEAKLADLREQLETEKSQFGTARSQLGTAKSQCLVAVGVLSLKGLWHSQSGTAMKQWSLNLQEERMEHRMEAEKLRLQDEFHQEKQELQGRLEKEMMVAQQKMLEMQQEMQQNLLQTQQQMQGTIDTLTVNFKGKLDFKTQQWEQCAAQVDALENQLKLASEHSLEMERVRQAEAMEASKQRAAVMTLHLMMRYSKLGFLRVVSEWRVHMMEMDGVERNDAQQRLLDKERQQVAEFRTQATKLRHQASFQSWCGMLFRWQQTALARLVHRWNRNIGVEQLLGKQLAEVEQLKGEQMEVVEQLKGKQMEEVEQLKEELKGEEERCIQEMLEVHEAKVKHQSQHQSIKMVEMLAINMEVSRIGILLRIWRAKVMYSHSVQLHASIQEVSDKLALSGKRDNAERVLDELRRAHKDLFMCAARAIAEWRVAQRCTVQVQLMSDTMCQTFEQQRQSGYDDFTSELMAKMQQVLQKIFGAFKEQSLKDKLENEALVASVEQWVHELMSQCQDMVKTQEIKLVKQTLKAEQSSEEIASCNRTIDRMKRGRQVLLVAMWTGLQQLQMALQRRLIHNWAGLKEVGDTKKKLLDTRQHSMLSGLASGVALRHAWSQADTQDAKSALQLSMQNIQNKLSTQQIEDLETRLRAAGESSDAEIQRLLKLQEESAAEFKFEVSKHECRLAEETTAHEKARTELERVREQEAKYLKLSKQLQNVLYHSRFAGIAQRLLRIDKDRLTNRMRFRGVLLTARSMHEKILMQEVQEKVKAKEQELAQIVAETRAIEQKKAEEQKASESKMSKLQQEKADLKSERENLIELAQSEKGKTQEEKQKQQELIKELADREEKVAEMILEVKVKQKEVEKLEQSLEETKGCVSHQVLKRVGERIKQMLDRTAITTAMLSIRCWRYQIDFENSAKKVDLEHHEQVLQIQQEQQKALKEEIEKVEIQEQAKKQEELRLAEEEHRRILFRSSVETKTETSVRILFMHNTRASTKAQQIRIALWRAKVVAQKEAEVEAALEEHLQEVKSKALHQAVIAVLVLTWQRYLKQRQMSVLFSWQGNMEVEVTKVDLQAQKLSEMSEMMSEAEERFEAALLEHDQAHEEQAEAHQMQVKQQSGNMVQLITSLSAVMEQDQWFTIQATNGIAVWRLAQQTDSILDIMDEEIANKQYELDEALYALENTENQLQECKRLQREMAGESGADLLLDKIDELEKLLAEKTKEAMQAEHAKKKAQEKLAKALQTVTKMKDARPPDVKEMEASRQVSGAVRARGILANWENTAVSRILLEWAAAACPGAVAVAAELQAAAEEEAMEAEKAAAAAEAVASSRKHDVCLVLVIMMMGVVRARSIHKSLMVIYQWRLKMKVQQSKQKAQKGTEERMMTQISLAKQSQECNELELQSKLQELEAARQSRIKLKGMIMRLKRKSARLLILVWMANDKLVSEVQSSFAVRALRVWIQQWSEHNHQATRAFIKESAHEKLESLRVKLIKSEEKLEVVALESQAVHDAGLQELAEEKDALLAEKDALLAEKDALLAEKDAEKERTLAEQADLAAKEKLAAQEECARLQALIDLAKQEAIRDLEQAAAKLEQLRAEHQAEIEKIKNLASLDASELVRALEIKRKLDSTCARLLTAGLVQTQRSVEDQRDHLQTVGAVLMWHLNTRNRQLALCREELATSMDRVRTLGQQKMMAEEYSSSVEKTLAKRDSKIMVMEEELASLQGGATESEAMNIRLQEQIRKMDLEYLTLSEDRDNIRSWLLARVGAGIIRVLQFKSMSEWLRCARRSRAQELLTYRKSVAPLLMSAYANISTRKNDDDGWKKALAVPFLHWSGIAYRNAVAVKLQRSSELVKRTISKCEAAQAQVQEMQQEQEDVLEEAREEIKDELVQAEAKNVELKDNLLKKSQERDIHVRRMTNQHHEILDLKGVCGMEQRRRLFAALIALRAQYPRRARIVCVQRWRNQACEETDPGSAVNKVQMSLDNMKKLAEEVKRMQDRDKKLQEAAAQAALKIQTLQEATAAAVSRSRRIYPLMVYSIWRATFTWQVVSVSQGFILWKVTTQGLAALRRAADRIEKAEENVSTLNKQKANMETFLSESEEKMIALQNAIVEKDELSKTFESRLFEVKKEAAAETQKLEEGFMEAMRVADMNRELAEEQSEVLEVTQIENTKTKKKVGEQRKEIQAESEAKAKLAEMYDKAMSALQKEQGTSAVFTAAVLKTHWLACKVYGIMKHAKGIGTGNEKKLTPDNLPMNSGVDVLRIDELMLREVYHWMKKNEQGDLSRHLKASISRTEEPPPRAPPQLPVEAPPVAMPLPAPSDTPIVLPLPVPEEAEEQRPPSGPHPFVLPDGALFHETAVEVTPKVKRKPVIRTVDEWVSDAGHQTSPSLERRPETPTFEGNKFSPLPPITPTGLDQENK